MRLKRSSTDPVGSSAATREVRSRGWLWLPCVLLAAILQPRLPATAASPVLPAGEVKPGTWLGRSLGPSIGDWLPDSPGRLRLDREVAEQKITLTLPAPVPLPDLLQNSAELLQCVWTPDGRAADRLVLRRDPVAVRMLRARAAAEAELAKRARNEQRVLMMEAAARPRKALDGPVEEIFPGHWGRRGVPSGSERMIPFLDTLTPGEWNRLFQEAQFVGGNAPGTRSIVPHDPILSWRVSRLPRERQQIIQSYLGSLGGSYDYSRVTVFLSNRNGRELVMRLYFGRWGQVPLVIGMEGPALRRLKTGSEEPLFLPNGPAFCEAIPRELERRSSEDVSPRWKELDYAQACEALSRLMKTPVLADYYTLHQVRMSLSTDRIKLGEVFRLFQKTFGCSFAWRRGMLLVRRGDWPRLDAREIPERILEPCAALKRPTDGWVTLDTAKLAALAAAIRAEQIPCLMSYSDRDNRSVSLAPEGLVLRDSYDILRLLGSLSPAGQARLLGPGLRWSEAYRAAPGAYLEMVRRRAPWVFDPETEEGMLRLALTDPPSLAFGLPDALPALQLEFVYREGISPVRDVQVTRVPWKVTTPARRK